MTTETHPPQPPYPTQPPPPQKKGMAIASMVLGIVAVVLAFIPILGIVAFLLGAIAIILGIVALIKKRGKGQAITGLITGIVSFIIAGIVTAITGAFIGAVDEGIQQAQDDLEADVEEAAAESDEDVEADIDEIEETVEEEEEPVEEATGEWVEVATLSGTGDQRGEVFTIEGDARVIYDFAAAEEEWAMATVYLVPEGDSLAEDGGIPEVMIDGSDSGENLLYQTGSYYLDVSALDYESWTVTIEEQQ